MCAIEPIARWSLSMLFVDLRRALIREFLLSSTVVTSWKISLHGVINSFVDLLLFQRVHCERGISHVCHRNLSQQLTVKWFWGLLVHKYARENAKVFLSVANFVVDTELFFCFFFFVVMWLMPGFGSLINDLLTIFSFLYNISMSLAGSYSND